MSSSSGGIRRVGWISIVTTTELLIQSLLQKECRHVAHVDLEVRVQHCKGGRCDCWNAFTGTCHLSAGYCRRPSRSAEKRSRRSFVCGADCSPALACSDRSSTTAPGRRPAT